MARKKKLNIVSKSGKLPITVYVNPELKKKISEVAARYGSSVTGMASMAMYTGIKKIEKTMESK